MAVQAQEVPTQNEWVGRGMGSSQPGEGGLAHPQATYMSPKPFLLLACLSLLPPWLKLFIGILFF
jgi:hypothetical protein